MKNLLLLLFVFFNQSLLSNDSFDLESALKTSYKNKLHINTSTKLIQDIYKEPIKLNTSKNTIYSVKKNLNFTKLKNNLELLINSDKITDSDNLFTKQHIRKKNTINFALAYKNEFLNVINLKTQVGLKLNNKTNPFLKLTTNKKWENIYGIDYTIGQSISESIIQELEYKSYFKLDKKINDNYSIHNYNESLWKDNDHSANDFHSSISLNHKITNTSYLVYKINLNTTLEDETSYNLKLKYKVTIL